MTSYESHLPSLQWISQEYHELNGSHIEVLDSPPTPLQFSRISHISRPVIIKGVEIAANNLRWTNEYLERVMGDRPISVAVTPNGMADAVTRAPDDQQYFVEPHVESMTICQLLNQLDDCQSDNKEAYYLQSQNGNLYSSSSDETEFAPLRPDVPPDVSWCSEAFDKQPDAVNLWIGNGRSITSIHSDPYENIYTVVRGVKYFTLLPPSHGWHLKERSYPHAQYARDATSGQLIIQPSSESVPEIRWSSVSPDLLPPDAHPIHITVRAGESLYLPAGWWHHVRQASEVTIALNWWYDIEMQGMSWVMLTFLRGAGHLPVQGSDEEHGLKPDGL